MYKVLIYVNIIKNRFNYFLICIINNICLFCLLSKIFIKFVLGHGNQCFIVCKCSAQVGFNSSQ